jgi:hypothetical protein
MQLFPAIDQEPGEGPVDVAEAEQAKVIAGNGGLRTG